ncbi:4-hydroxybenzoate transporter [Klebsiella pneumoniae subsp. ozaenae]|uniref:4-hydroxybenzoate transporter n=1 Tax=Klebsiella pneumoniae subsp. ozaenae TaxID=574 RepID=A0A378AX34_KLEPO|nr:4-hydroxybenzoate transporter [Klebsiella pneumoniae subsp. ozaenae]
MTKTTIDIQAFINEHPFTRYQWMILALCFITVAMDGFDTANYRVHRLRPGARVGRWKNRPSAR